jgi:cytochrome c553
MNMRLILSVLATLLLSAPAGADSTSGASLIAACAHCHGTDGNSSSGQYPSLARQNKEYLIKQLLDFKAKIRTDIQMSPMVGVLTENDVQLVANFFSGENLVRQRGIDEDLAAEGKKLAAELKCASCHQKTYRGKKEVPRIARQKRVYLVKQMKDYRDGKRTNDDGVKMPAVKNLTDDQIKVLSHYFAGM